jgi:hypothetical protein
MSEKRTIEDLQVLRDELASQRSAEAFRLLGPHAKGQLAALANLQVAIAALDAVIESAGKGRLA